MRRRLEAYRPDDLRGSAAAEAPRRSSSAPGWTAQRVTILGMARQGLALARYLIGSGAIVTLSDVRPVEQLTGEQAALQQFVYKLRALGTSAVPPQYALGGHPLDLLERTDLLCLSGGVSPALPIVQAAVARGIPLSNDSLLTLMQCPVPVLGITGSAGKTTTTTLTGLMLEAAGLRVHVGGNIGTPLIDQLDAIGPGDKVVMELSSFQLELFDRSPAIAAITNITPNHLDRHPSMSHYTAAKANILRHQERGDTCVLNADDPVTAVWLRTKRCEVPAGAGQPAVYFPLRSNLFGFSLEQEVEVGTFLSGDRLTWRGPGAADREICRVGDIRLRGRHNVANMLAASCLAGIAGAEATHMAAVARSFNGVEHRLEVVRQRAGIMWVNDSMASAPERSLAAMRAFNEPIVLLAGGRDKNLPWADFAAEAHRSVRHLVLFGEASGLIAEAMQRYESEHGLHSLPASVCSNLAQAVELADHIAEPGDVVLLSPGGTSFDAYPDFAARGHHFRHLVEALP